MTAECPGTALPLASNGGWSDFGKWAESLDPKYGRIKQLWQRGITGTAEWLGVELEHALINAPPKDPTVHETVENLLRIAETAGDAEYLAVTNGMGEDEGEDEVDEEAAEYDPK